MRVFDPFWSSFGAPIGLDSRYFPLYCGGNWWIFTFFQVQKYFIFSKNFFQEKFLKILNFHFSKNILWISKNSEKVKNIYFVWKLMKMDPLVFDKYVWILCRNVWKSTNIHRFWNFWILWVHRQKCIRVPNGRIIKVQFSTHFCLFKFVHIYDTKYMLKKSEKIYLFLFWKCSRWTQKTSSVSTFFFENYFFYFSTFIFWHFILPILSVLVRIVISGVRLEVQKGKGQKKKFSKKKKLFFEEFNFYFFWKETKYFPYLAVRRRRKMVFILFFCENFFYFLKVFWLDLDTKIFFIFFYFFFILFFEKFLFFFMFFRKLPFFPVDDLFWSKTAPPESRSLGVFFFETFYDPILSVLFFYPMYLLGKFILFIFENLFFLFCMKVIYFLFFILFDEGWMYEEFDLFDEGFFYFLF